MRFEGDAAMMLEFCTRHGIQAITGHVPMRQVNAALNYLCAGRARYRIVLDRK